MLWKGGSRMEKKMLSFLVGLSGIMLILMVGSSQAMSVPGFDAGDKMPVLGEGNLVQPTSPEEINLSLTAQDNQPINIPDQGLANLIRITLDISEEQDITKHDMKRLTVLTDTYIQGRGIQDLTGLQYAVNLTELHLENNQITDISVLSNLTNLTNLDLGGNQITDISALSNLTNLSELNLDYNQITDISALSNLTNLTRLGLGDNRIEDISALSNLTNLNELYLWDNQIEDISSLVSNTGIGKEGYRRDYVNLDHNYLTGSKAKSDIQILEDREVLVFSGSQRNLIPDYSLEYVIKETLGIKRITKADMARLTDLDARGCSIQDLTGLQYAVNLTNLNLEWNQITDISALSNLTNLSELYLDYNQITDISALSNLTNLTRLGLWDNQIEDISPLVSNSGIGKGDFVNLSYNDLDLTHGSKAMSDIQILEDRGVKVD